MVTVAPGYSAERCEDLKSTDEDGNIRSKSLSVNPTIWAKQYQTVIFWTTSIQIHNFNASFCPLFRGRLVVRCHYKAHDLVSSSSKCGEHCLFCLCQLWTCAPRSTMVPRCHIVHVRMLYHDVLESQSGWVWSNTTSIIPHLFLLKVWRKSQALTSPKKKGSDIHPLWHWIWCLGLERHQTPSQSTL